MNYREGLYWINTQSNNIQSYNAERITNINFAFYNNIRINNISTTTNDEMSLEFWIYIYTYIDNSFKHLEINWEKQLDISFVNENANTFQVKCSSFIDNYGTSLTQVINYKKWY